MTREEVITNLNTIKTAFIKSVTKEQKELINDTFDTAIKVLEQEPETVFYIGDGYADGSMVYDMAECPNCGYEYELFDKDWGLSYCPHCGQALKWESEGL